MLTYNVASLAYLAIANEALSLVSAVIGNIRYDFAKQTKDTNSFDRAAENTEADASAAPEAEEIRN